MTKTNKVRIEGVDPCVCQPLRGWHILITILQLAYLVPGFGARTLIEPRMYW
jgi:hypothetical protein